MPSSLTRRLLTLLAVAAATAAAACADSTLAPAPDIEGRSAASADSGRPSAPPPARPDSARPDSSARPDTAVTPPPSRPDSSSPPPSRPDSVVRPDTARVGAAVVLGLAVENFVFQYRDAAGVSHDSVGVRGVGGVTITVSATTPPDSTSSTPPTERRVATVTSDAKGVFRTGTLPDGWYVVRATHTAGGTTRTASARATLGNGYQYPSLVYLNLR